jgi:hypothetical protein
MGIPQHQLHRPPTGLLNSAARPAIIPAVHVGSPWTQVTVIAGAAINQHRLRGVTDPKSVRPTA